MSALPRIPRLVTALALVGFTLSGAWAAAPDAGATASSTEQRQVPAFQAIEVAGPIDLVVRQGPQQVQVQADSALRAQLESVVVSGAHGATLRLRWKPRWNLLSHDAVKVTVSVPQLVALAASGSGEVRVEPFRTPSLTMALSGSGDARLDGLQADELAVAIAGSGDLRASGKASVLKASIAGSGAMKFADLHADQVTVDIAGSGSAAFDVSQTLTVSIAGSGDVTYSGQPQVKSSVIGSGRVRRR